MKQKIVIKVSMPSDKKRSRAMSLTASADGVISVGIIGNAKDRMEVIGDGVDTVCLVQCLRKKVGYAEILHVEEVKDTKAEEKKSEEKPEEKKSEETKVVVHQQPYYYFPGGYYQHHHPTQMVVYEDQNNCAIM